MRHAKPSEVHAAIEAWRERLPNLTQENLERALFFAELALEGEQRREAEGLATQSRLTLYAGEDDDGETVAITLLDAQCFIDLLRAELKRRETP